MSDEDSTGKFIPYEFKPKLEQTLKEIPEPKAKDALVYEDERKPSRAMKKGDGKKGRGGKFIAFVIGFLAGGALIYAFAYFNLASFLFPQREIQQEESTFDTTLFREEISTMSEFTTAKMDYTGIIECSSGDIPLINYNHFWLVYSGEVTAGIDLREARVSTEGTSIVVTIPHSTHTDPLIDPDALQILTDERSIFMDDAQQVIDAEKKSTDDMEANVDYSDLLSQADSQAETLIHGLVDNEAAKYGYTVDVRFTDDTEQSS